MYIKPLLKPENTYNKPCFKTAYLGQNVINLLKQKVAQYVAISLGFLIFSKIIMSSRPIGEKLLILVTLSLDHSGQFSGELCKDQDEGLALCVIFMLKALKNLSETIF